MRTDFVRSPTSWCTRTTRISRACTRLRVPLVLRGSRMGSNQMRTAAMSSAPSGRLPILATARPPTSLLSLGSRPSAPGSRRAGLRGRSEGCQLRDGRSAHVALVASAASGRSPATRTAYGTARSTYGCARTRELRARCLISAGYQSSQFRDNVYGPHHEKPSKQRAGSAEEHQRPCDCVRGPPGRVDRRLLSRRPDIDAGRGPVSRLAAIRCDSTVASSGSNGRWDRPCNHHCHGRALAVACRRLLPPGRSSWCRRDPAAVVPDRPRAGAHPRSAFLGIFSCPPCSS